MNEFKSIKEKMMTRTLLTIATSSLLMLGCFQESESTKASDSTITLSGIAAAGYAMTDAEITITDADGDIVFDGKANDRGEYLARLEKTGLEVPLVIRAAKSDLVFEALVMERLESKKEVRAHVNAVTDLIVREARELLREELGENLRGLDGETLRPRVADLVKELIGERFAYEDFASREDFVPALEGRPEVVPTMEDMVLHAMAERARAEEMPIHEWVRLRQQEAAALGDHDPEFQARLMTLAQTYRIAAPEVERRMGADMEALRARFDELVKGMTPCMVDAVAPIIEGLIRTQMALQDHPADSVMIKEHQDRLQAELQGVLAQVRERCAALSNGGFIEVEFKDPIVRDPMQEGLDIVHDGENQVPNSTDVLIITPEQEPQTTLEGV
jgi:hypothetical protein